MADRFSDAGLDQLRTFLAVYRAGSMTAGAREVGLSQSTVTSQIQALEQQSGRQLFERVPRGVHPTAVADELAARVAGPLDALARALTPSDLRLPPEPVHLAGPAELLAVRAVPALAPLIGRGVRLRITAGLADDLIEGLQLGRFDLLLSPVRPRGRTLLATPLHDEEFVLVAAGPLDPERAPLIAYAEDIPIVRRYWRHVFGRRLTKSPAVVIPDLRGVLAAVTAGAGWSVLPRYLCAAELASGALELLHDPEDPPINTVFLIRRSAAGAGSHVELVQDTLLSEGRTW
ncbi:LysR family transcriptional regulator [Actinoplanes friuliensis]|uniref:LysR family transcriptional regulator n=1 Tax=Actinoplanes friuliensis DSM 7358 TaxID=1246995 RepID=U5VZK1_9ACTN|nr:LysR family transcriptional regulator [Actinoplanes friuliensis]AGZ42319.1 LysR family transcriptional regulator [Actinoplanes friuliensis DSM 7358]